MNTATTMNPYLQQLLELELSPDSWDIVTQLYSPLLPASATTSSAVAGVLNPAAMMAASGGLPAALALNPALIPGLNLNLMAQDKINRELFVANTPPGTSEALLQEFLNRALKRVGLAAANHTKSL
jgi:hypothetical protein